MKKIDLVERAKSIILTPNQEWELIEREQYEIKDLYTNYVMILAAIPAVAAFIGLTLVGGLMVFFVFGLITAWLYRRSQGLAASLAFHAFNNAFAALAIVAVTTALNKTP